MPDGGDGVFALRFMLLKSRLPENHAGQFP
jgi:hypothetical protein